MKDKQRLFSKYPDLLSLNTDPDLLKLVGDLHIVATAAEPPQYLTSSIDAALEERQAGVAAGVEATATPHDKLLPWQQNAIQPATSRRRWKLWHPVTRLGWVIATVVLLFSLSIAGYAMAPLFIASNFGIEHLEAGGLGKELNLSQRIDGYTVRVGWAYADGNQVLLRYDISPYNDANGLSMAPDSPIELRDDQGRLFRVIAGGMWEANNIGRSTLYATFDTAMVTDNPAALNLHFSTNVHGVTPPYEMKNLITPGVTPPPRETGPTIGPFNFDFSVPFTAARVEHVGQTVEANGVTVTLDELRVAPSEARATIHFSQPAEPANLEWRPDIDLRVGTWRPGLDPEGHPREGSTSTAGPTKDGGWYFSWPSVPDDSQDVWTVTVRRLIGYTADLNPQAGLVGPWTFQVSLPK